MHTTEIAVALDDRLLKQIDQLVMQERYPSRNWVIQEAVKEKLKRADHSRLAHECAKLDPVFEQQMADEGLAGDLAEWPQY